VSGDRSPQSGSGLDVTAQPEAGNGAAIRPVRPEPSLARVIATTLRLWLRRRVLRVADGNRIGPLRWTAVVAVTLIACAAAGGGAAAALKTTPPIPSHPRHHVQRITPAQAGTTADEQAAAAWIVAQIAPGTAIACDPVMSSVLRRAGLPAARELALSPASGLPVGPGLVVATSAARAEFGSQLTAAAPEVVASFGRGAQIVEVRVLGWTPAAFRSAARAAIAANKKAAAKLARNRRLHLAGSARAQLLSGLVDERLVVLLGRLVAARPVYVSAFGNADPGDAWPAELRSVSISRLVHGTGRRRVSDVRAVLRLLHGQRPPYRAIVQELHGPAGRVTLTIGFPAPSPLPAPRAKARRGTR
jgi:hypothetical protein